MLYQYAIKQNAFFWHHVFLAWIGVDLVMMFGVSDQWAFISVVFGLAVAFEFFQFYVLKGWQKHSVPEGKLLDHKNEYWKKRVFKLDSLGDMAAASLGGLGKVLFTSWIGG